MSVTIVSTLPKSTPAATTDNAASNATGSDNAAAAQDFASLLLGQMAPIAPDILPITTLQTDLPEADGAPTDAASLLVALGIVRLEPGRTADATQVTDSSLSGIGKVDATTSDSLTALQTTPAVGQSLKLDVKTEAIKAEPVLTGATATDDDKPAKLAVATSVAASVEAVIANSVTDSTPNNLSALTVNSINLPHNREVSLSVPTPIRDQSWAGDFGQKIVWLATSDKQSAQLTLNPPQMGPIEISLNLDKGNASASFVSANAEVRDAIETALPRLREMFASAGIELGQTNVSAESFRQQPGSGEGNRSTSQWMSDNAILVADSAGSLPARAFAVQQGNGLVNVFA